MRRAILALVSMILLAGWPRQALFVVLPNAEGGGVGAITVGEGETATTLDQPYATAESRAGNTAPIEESREGQALPARADRRSNPQNRRVEITVR